MQTLLDATPRENPTDGGVAMWSDQFVKAWSKTMGVLLLSSGESEEAAVVRAATEGMGLQSILNDFCLCGHVSIKSDATAAIGMVECWRLVGATPCSSWENSSFQHVRTGQSERCTNKVPRTRTIAALYENV